MKLMVVLSDKPVQTIDRRQMDLLSSSPLLQRIGRERTEAGARVRFSTREGSLVLHATDGTPILLLCLFSNSNSKASLVTPETARQKMDVKGLYDATDLVGILTNKMQGDRATPTEFLFSATSLVPYALRLDLDMNGRRINNFNIVQACHTLEFAYDRHGRRLSFPGEHVGQSSRNGKSRSLKLTLSVSLESVAAAKKVSIKGSKVCWRDDATITMKLSKSAPPPTILAPSQPQPNAMMNANRPPARETPIRLEKQAMDVVSNEMEVARESFSDPSKHPQEAGKPKVKDALAYLEQVKKKYSGQPEVYNRFLDLMKAFKSKSLTAEGVIKGVKKLFKGEPHLLLGFNQFLPPGYRITLQNSQPPPPKPGPRTALDFNHAVQYISKIKSRFRNSPEVYGEFLDILHEYQANRSIDDAFSRFKQLFKGHADLLDEFKYFLPPRAGPPPPRSNGVGRRFDGPLKRDMRDRIDEEKVKIETDGRRMDVGGENYSNKRRRDMGGAPIKTGKIPNGHKVHKFVPGRVFVIDVRLAETSK